MSASSSRPLPAVTAHTEPFWHGGADGELRVRRCPVDGHLWHPSQVVCPDHPGTELEVAAVSGRGHLIGFTVNHQMWHPAFPPPYVIGVVALEEEPSVRITANVVHTEPDALEVQAPVRVVFEQVGEVWFPAFELTGGPAGGSLPPLPQVAAAAGRPMASADRFESKVAVTGVGLSEVGRRLMRPAISLTVEAVQAAVADAGLTLADIDGLATYPGGGLSAGGMSEGGVVALEEALGIHPVWHCGAMETPGQCGSIMNAMLAVAAGLCRHVLCFRTVWEATATELQRSGTMAPPGGGGRVTGDMQWRLPFGAMSASNWIGMNASQYFHRYGVGREVLGRIAVNGRTMASRNPEAVYRDPMTMDDYYDARMITTPFGLYDCDVPMDGAVAVIISSRDVADDLRQSPVLVEAVGSQITERVSWDQGTTTHLTGVFGAGASLWNRTDLTPGDVDVAEIYDGFSFNAVSWLEAMGFCGLGEATDFVGDGSRIALDGDLPMNTHGGQLSAGRTHGYGFFREAVLQLRGQAGDRQVPDARVAAVAVGGGVPGGCFLLTSA
jgi:acetyl-CoA acetyltransferase/uncharacterized OB-fold protein